MNEYKGVHYDPKVVLRELRDRFRMQCALEPVEDEPTPLEQAAIYSACYRVEHPKNEARWWMWRFFHLFRHDDLPTFVLEAHRANTVFGPEALQLFRQAATVPEIGGYTHFSPQFRIPCEANRVLP